MSEANGHHLQSDGQPAVFDRPETGLNGAADVANIIDLSRLEGRDLRGRFAEGCKPGPGRPRSRNPFTRMMGALRAAAVEAVSADDLRRLVSGLVERANAGDLGAAKLVLAYIIGKPAPAIDPDDVGHDEWRRFQAGPSLVDVNAVTAAQVEPATATAFLEANRAANPAVQKLANPAVLEAAGRRLLEEQGIAFTFEKRGQGGPATGPPPAT
jgi:hypothetical protein